MSILKVIEILSDSEVSWEDATRKAVKKAGKTVKNIKSVYVKEQSATVKNDELATFRVNVKITFAVEG